MSNFQEWDKSLDEMNSDKHKLYDQMKANPEQESAEVLWRLAKVSMLLAKGYEKDKHKDKEKAITLEALDYATKACKKDPNNKECHKWYCGAVGHLSALVGNKEKIKYGHEFKEHADIALKLDPNDSYMQFMYGRWAYEVASLSWLEKKLATTLYGKVPECDYDTALNAFKKSDELRPKSKETYMWMSKVYMAKKQTADAKKWIEDGLTLPNNNVADEVAHNELITLKAKCK